MTVALHEFSLKVKTAEITPACPSFRPSKWPPPRDWPVVIDRNGDIVSRWGDPRWDLSLWAGTSCSLNFSDAEESLGGSIDDTNGDLLRLAIGYLIWGPEGIHSVSTITTKFSYLRRIFAFCSNQGINAANLMRFPKVIDLLAEIIARSAWKPTLNLFEHLYDARETLGFTVFDTWGLTRLARAAEDYVPVQTPYIPPRIWEYQFIRLRECLDDFLASKEQIESCFKFCLEHYIKNYGSLENALAKGKPAAKGPFTARSELRRGCTYLGPFRETAANFRINHLLEKWLGPDNASSRISAFSTYLSLVTLAGLAYIANLTLQRKEEVSPIRSSCLLWEHDEKLGRIAIIRAPTTKTEDDSDARWAASPSVEAAVTALSTIAHLRMLCDAENPRINPTAQDCKDPLLNTTSTEPWASGTGACTPYNIRVPLDGLTALVRRYPRLFSEDELRINSEDLKIARQLTPNLCEKTFAVGNVWPLSWHQYRRTGAVNMFSSGIISDSSIQQQIKHLTLLMSAYYGRNHTRLHLNEEMKETVVAAMYEMTARRLQNVVSDRFMSPNSPERKDGLAVTVLSAKDVKSLTNWAKAGKVSFRENRLGGCMQPGPCEYGGVESVARCGGGDGGKPCTDVLYDREKEPHIKKQLLQVKGQMEQLTHEQPRYKALDAERQAMENYLNVIAAS